MGCDRYLALGATLCGAVQEWFRGVFAPGVPFDTLDAESAAVPAGAEGLRLLPYLQGERTPIWDAGARGAFVGLSLAHGRGHLYRAVLEGIALSLRHCLEVLRERGTQPDEVVAVNGGARSALWRQILCDALARRWRISRRRGGSRGRRAPGRPRRGRARRCRGGQGLARAAGASRAGSRTRRDVHRMLAERRPLYPALRRVA